MASLKKRLKSKTKGNCVHFLFILMKSISGFILERREFEKTRQILNIKRYNVFKSILFPSSVARSLCAIICGTASILFLIWLHNCDNFIRHCRALFETFGRDATRELRGVVKKCRKLCTRSSLWWDDLMNSGEGWKSGNKYFLHMSLFKVRESSATLMQILSSPAVLP